MGDVRRAELGPLHGWRFSTFSLGSIVIRVDDRQHAWATRSMARRCYTMRANALICLGSIVDSFAPGKRPTGKRCRKVILSLTDMKRSTSSLIRPLTGSWNCMRTDGIDGARTVFERDEVRYLRVGVDLMIRIIEYDIGCEPSSSQPCRNRDSGWLAHVSPFLCRFQVGRRERIPGRPGCGGRGMPRLFDVQVRLSERRGFAGTPFVPIRPRGSHFLDPGGRGVSVGPRGFRADVDIGPQNLGSTSAGARILEFAKVAALSRHIEGSNVRVRRVVACRRAVL